MGNWAVMAQSVLSAKLTLHWNIRKQKVDSSWICRIFVAPFRFQSIICECDPTNDNSYCHCVRETHQIRNIESCWVVPHMLFTVHVQSLQFFFSLSMHHPPRKASNKAHLHLPYSPINSFNCDDSTSFITKILCKHKHFQSSHCVCVVSPTIHYLPKIMQVSNTISWLPLSTCGRWERNECADSEIKFVFVGRFARWCLQQPHFFDGVRWMLMENRQGIEKNLNWIWHWILSLLTY